MVRMIILCPDVLVVRPLMYLIIGHMARVGFAGHLGVVTQRGADTGDDHVEVLDTFDGGHGIDKLVDVSLLPR